MGSTRSAIQATLLADGVKLQFLWATLMLVGVLLAGAVIIALVERWRRKSGTEGLSAGDQLSHFRKLYDQGAISKEEYERIRSQLASQFKQEVRIESPPAAPSPAPASPDVMTMPEPPPPPPPGA